MNPDLVNILMFIFVPIVPLMIGLVLTIKGGIGLYQSMYSYMTVNARCVNIQEIPEEGSNYILYRPVFEYVYEGKIITASKIGYERENHVQIGSQLPIVVEKKHPDVVMDSKPNMVSSLILLFVGCGLLFPMLGFVLLSFFMFLLRVSMW